MSSIIPDPWRDHRDREAQKKWNEDRLERLHASLRTHVGRTVWLDVTTTANQLAPRILGHLVVVREHDLDVVDMSDASLPPSAKPRLTIELASIRDWRST